MGAFLFSVVDHPEELIEIHEGLEKANPNQSRLLTGWCWDWSQRPLEDGSLRDEVSVPEVIS